MQPNIPDTTRDLLISRALRVTTDNFDALALDIFGYQFTHNPVYHQFCGLLGKSPHNVKTIRDIPFLPVSLFKTQDIRTNVWEPEIVFETSTTTGQVPGKHPVRSLSLYHTFCFLGVRHVFGKDVNDFVWLALLPSYQTRPSSSLISMISTFLKTGKQGSDFLTPDNAKDKILTADQSGTPVICMGVSYALLDLIEKQPIHLSNTMIFETGGMKGRRMEMTREALHEALCKGFGVQSIGSEYGMTELFSQAWSLGDGIFHPSPTLKIIVRDLSDPGLILSTRERGGINCIDLGNVDTCAFLATDDIGIVRDDGSFEVLGRYDASELRGCNLMADQF